jgi:hypothetical protein
MATIVTRSGKGSPLTNNEVDANFTNLNTELGTKANTSSLATVATTGAYADLTGKPTLVDASNVAITGGSITGTTIDSITNHVGADHIHYKIKATQILAKGDVVKVVGFNAGENAFEVAKVSASTDIAVGVVYSALSSGALGSIINTGLLEGIDTSAFAIGTTLYPNTSGGFTSTKPTSGRYQALAFVVRSNANNGTILIEASEPQATSLSQFTNDSGYITGITSGNVTTALGYTPANRAGDTFTGPITVNSGANQAILGSDGAIELTRGAGGAYIDFKDSTAEDFDVRLQASGSQLNISAAGGLTLNGAGVLTGITSGQVTTALGYTPYNATNPAGYITSAGSISGNAATATNISNTGTVTLASATESNSIYATAPSYTADQPTKLLNFDWYGNVFSLGNIRSGSTPSSGFGVYYTPSGGSRAEFMRIDTSGSVLINRTSASGIGKLNVEGGVDVTSGNVTVQAGYGIAWRGDQSRIMTPDDNSYGALIRWGATGGCRLFESTTERLRIDGTGSVTAFVDVRAPIFYDSNNTNRYLDPSSTSVLTTVEAYGSGFRSLVNGSASISSQLYFANAANTRAWNWQLDENDAAALWSYGGSSWGKRLGLTHNSELFLRNSSGSDVSLAYPSTFGYSSSYKTMVLGNQSLTTVCIGVSPASNPSGSFNGGGLGLEVMFRNGVNFITPNSANNGYHFPLSLADGYTASSGSFRAPIFYDSENTAYYVDPNGGSRTGGITADSLQSLGNLTVNSGLVYRSDWTTRFQSGSDFTSGTLVTTDIPATGFAGESFVIEITGKSYSATNLPFKVVAQGYLYNDTIINYTGISYGGDFATYIKVFEEGGVLKFWWPRISYWNSFNVNVMAMDGATNNTITRNRVTAIANSTEPTGTKKQQINLSRFMRGDVSATNSIDVRAPIFYDSNNTAFYADPDATTNLSTVYGNEFYSRGWFRNNNSNTGLYNQETAQHWWSDSGSYWNMGGGNINGQGIRFRDTHNGTVRGYVYYDQSNNVGFLNNEGNWRARVVGGDYFLADGSSARAQLFYDSNDTAYYVDPNSTSRLSVANVNFLTLLNDEGLNVKGIRGQFAAGSDGQGISLFSNVDIGYPSGWGSGLGNTPSRGLSVYGGLRVAYSGGGFITSDTSVRSPIFYDSNDTAYYVDPTVSSNLNDLIVTRNIASPSNYYADLQLEVQATSGTAGIGLHRAGYSHCGIYHDSINQLKFNFNNGTVTLNHNAGSLIGTGNDETYIRLRDAVTSEDWNSYIDGAEASYRIVTNATGANRAGAYNYGVLLSMANAGQAKFQLYAPHNGTDGNGLWVRTGWDGDYDAWNEIAIQSRSFTNNVDLRAPIFYDSQNTAYFADPNGRSRLASMDYGDGGYYFAGGDWGYRHNTPYGWIQFGPANSGHAHIYTDRSNFYFNAQIQVLGGSQINQNDIRSPIFYDTDNTGYYINPANEYSANFAGYTYFGNHGGGNVGNYSSYRYQLVWAIGDSYKGTLDGTSVAGGYGLWFSHPNAGGVASNLSTHGLMLIQNGAFMASLDPSMRAVNDMRAPIYYDLNNTGYYWNFGDAAVSNINTVITGVAYYRSNLGSSAYSGAQSSPPLQVYSSDAGTAMFSFHRAGYYAVNMGLDPDNVLRIGGWSASANRLQLDMSGNLTMAGNVTAYSDARLKEDVATITNALDLVGKMRGVTYTRKDTGEAGVGVIAQEMLEVLPEVVQQGIGEDDTLSVAYGNLVGVLIEAIKELRDEVEMLRK